MSTLQTVPRKEQYTRLLTVLTDEIDRRIVRTLCGRRGPIPEQALLERLESAVSESKSRVTESDEEFLRIRLHHVHLPRLADDGLIEWDRSARTVALADVPISDLARLERAVSTRDREPFASALADDRRREILALCEAEDEPITRERLAERLTPTEERGRSAGTDLREIVVQLHHHHLPKLEAANLVEYDTDAGTVAYRGPSDLRTVFTESVADSC